MAIRTITRAPTIAVVSVALSVLGLAGCAGGGTPNVPVAQASTTTSTTSPPTPFVAADAHFTAVFAKTPTRSSNPKVVKGVTEQMISYICDTGNEVIYVGYLPLPGVPLPPSVPASLDAAIDGGASATPGVVTSRQHSTYLGWPSEDAVIAGAKATLRIRVVLIATTAFFLQGESPSADTPHPLYDRLLATFHTI